MVGGDDDDSRYQRAGNGGLGSSPAWQARLTFAMARHAIDDIAQVFRTAPTTPHSSKYQLSHADFQRLLTIVRPDQRWTEGITEAEHKLTEVRKMYEPYVAALSEYLVMPLPPWILSETPSTIGRRAHGAEFSD